jgi:hypothetical protein
MATTDVAAWSFRERLPDFSEWRRAQDPGGWFQDFHVSMTVRAWFRANEKIPGRAVKHSLGRARTTKRSLR